MRRNRLVWLIIWIISLIVISFWGGRVSYGFFTLVTLIPIISMAYLVLVYALFHIYQKIDSRWVAANQTVPFYFTLMNDYFIVFSGIRVEFYSSFSSISGLNEEIEYEIFPGSGITKETSLVCKYRGEYKVGIKNVIIQDFFRLFCFSYHNREPLTVRVKPQLVHLEGLKDIDIDAAVREATTSATDLDVLVRAYAPGDDIRQVHWGLTAKSNELMIRKRVGEEKQGIGILLSLKRKSKDEFVYLPIENKMLEVTLALALYFAKQGIDVNHFYRTDHLEMCQVSELEEFDEFYDMVSRHMFGEDKNDEYLFGEALSNSTLTRCKAVFLVVHEWSEATSLMVKQLNENDVYTIVCLIGDKADNEDVVCDLSRAKIINISPEEDLMEVLC